MSIKRNTLRIENEMNEKISFVADYEGRSVNNHILVLIRKNIESFEKQYGPIKGYIEPDVNVKPGRKQ